MSLDPILWALKDAPVADAEERLVLVSLAEAADEDGCNAWLSQATIAERALIHERTVRRRLDAMEKRGLIRRGDQNAVAHIPADNRPVVWDVAIPLSWFPNLGRVQEFRARKGRPPLTAETRPNLPPAPPKKTRADLGRKKDTADRKSEAPADSQYGRTTSPGGQEDRSDSQSAYEGTTSPKRGDWKSDNPPHDPPLVTHPFSDSFANAQEPAGSAPAQQALDGMPDPSPSPNQPAAAGSTEDEKAPETREEALPLAKKIANDWIGHLKSKNITIIDRSRKAKAGTVSRPFWALVDGLFVPAILAGADELDIKNAIVAAFDATGNTVPIWAVFERHLHAVQGTRAIAARGGYGGKPKTRVHIDDIDQAERARAAAAFGETPTSHGVAL